MAALRALACFRTHPHPRGAAPHRHRRRDLDVLDHIVVPCGGPKLGDHRRMQRTLELRVERQERELAEAMEILAYWEAHVDEPSQS